jgi:hypothetical protein
VFLRAAVVQSNHLAARTTVTVHPYSSLSLSARNDEERRIERQGEKEPEDAKRKEGEEKN